MREKSCKGCSHLEFLEDCDSDGYITGSWFVCNARPNVSNLKQFPFKKTTCSAHAPTPSSNGAGS